MLELKDIVVVYGKGSVLERTVLNCVNLTLRQGEFAALIGTNGSGKSTIAKVIAGEIIVNSGAIFIDKVDCTKLSVARRAPMISRVFQDPMNGTVPGLSVLENLIFASKRQKGRGFGLAVNSVDKNMLIGKLRVLGMGLEDKLDSLVGLLSGGQRQALSLLMATLSPAKLLLLDEHTAALDPEAAKLVMHFTHQIVQEHKLTALMITHDMEELEYCSHVYVISDGEINLMNNKVYSKLN